MTRTPLALLAAAGLALGAGSALAQTTLTVANWLPPSHPLVSELIVPLTEEIAAATEGRVSATLLPAPLGPPAAHFDFAVNGVADITFGVQGYSPGRFKTTNLAEVPFLGDSAEALSVGYWRTFDSLLREAGEYDQVKVLAVFTHGPGELFAKGLDLSAPDAISGAKIRVGGGIVHEIASQIGATPVEGPSSKSYELLSQGVADGILFPYESVAFFNLIPMLDQALEIPGGLYNTSFYIVMNKAKWDGLPEADKAALDAIFGEPLARKAGQMWDRADAAGKAAMEGKIDILTAGAEQLEALEAQLAPVIEAKVAEASETGIDGAAALEMLKAETAKAAAE